MSAVVEDMTRKYERLTDARLAKKISHLRRAASRCTLPANADLMMEFLDAALRIARRRIPQPPTGTDTTERTDV